MIADEDKVAASERDFRTAHLTDRERAMLQYAVKLTNHPSEMENSDVAALQGIGFTDAEILDICQVTAYYAYANRLVDGLGVELENYWDDST